MLLRLQERVVLQAAQRLQCQCVLGHLSIAVDAVYERLQKPKRRDQMPMISS